MQVSGALRRVGLALGLALTYFAAARAGLALAFVAEQVSPVWPPTGIALAAVLLFGYHVWPGIWLGAFLVNLGVQEPTGTAAAIAAGNTLEAIAGAWLLHRVAGFHPALERLRDVLGLLGLALVAAMISATMGVASLWLAASSPGRLRPALVDWWLGDAAGALVVTPALLTWGRASAAGRRVVEAAALFGAPGRCASPSSPADSRESPSIRSVLRLSVSHLGGLRLGLAGTARHVGRRASPSGAR